MKSQMTNATQKIRFTLFINMLQFEKETKHQSNRNFIKTITITSQIFTDYTPQVIQNSSHMNSIYQNTTNEIQPPKD